ncbi:hypothetical protein CBR_g53698 [Chara braunii]|uniref:Uncharacterized protein n=1 Tax=Chara braunii TaxID=69332 RepID=A0A388MBH8_CHABU|nr:hypothetical protein CBR_g53698 [Chara braunii]|eukprot:GBG91809.1 hypothetical protein CBR_g53698 [Chara braunii]
MWPGAWLGMYRELKSSQSPYDLAAKPVFESRKRYLQEEVEAFQLEEQDTALWTDRYPPQIITGELQVVHDGFFPHSGCRLRATIPSFVVDEVFGGVGGLVEAYLTATELERFSRGDLDIHYIYYSLVTPRPQCGDERIQLIELIRSIAPSSSGGWRDESYEWRHPPPSYVWDLLDHELRVGPDYITSIGVLFVDHWDSWWGSEALIAPYQLTRYYEIIGASGYHVAAEVDDGDVDDEEAWEPDWVDSDDENFESEDEVEEADEVDEAEADMIHSPRIVVGFRAYA